MEMVFKTKMRKNAGSMITVVPAGLTKLLNAESGDTLIWTANIKEDEVVVTIKPERKAESV